MKKFMMLMVVSLLFSSVATAQAKVDLESHKKKMAASDADVENPKKNAKAGFWIDRGNVYYAAHVAPKGDLRLGMSPGEINLLVGKPKEVRQEQYQGQMVSVWVYPFVDVYVHPEAQQVVFWKRTTSVAEDGLDVAFDAYRKAVELDPKQANKAKGLIEKLINEYREEGSVAFNAVDYPQAAQAFKKAYIFSADPIVDTPDELSAYNAGYISLLAKDYKTAQEYLLISKELGHYGDPEGEIHFMLYHAYNELGDSKNAEETLKEGIQLFPANSKLIETLVLHYTTTGQDATQMIPLVESALEKDPENFVFHFSLGMIYDKLGDYEKSIASFENATKLNPDDFSSYFNMAIVSIRYADKLQQEELAEIPMNELERYEAKLNEINSYYKDALNPLLKAHELKPTEVTTLELIKNVYFRFRDESPEMMANFEKYNELFKQAERAQ